MLAMNSYPRDYVEQRRARLAADVAAWDTLPAAPADLEAVFFNNLVLALEHGFVHRTRTLEKKDGNALNEVRVLCASLLGNDGRMAADTQIKLDPARSVLGYKVGDDIRVTRDEFVRLAEAFFAELERKFPATG